MLNIPQRLLDLFGLAHIEIVSEYPDILYDPVGNIDIEFNGSAVAGPKYLSEVVFWRITEIPLPGAILYFDHFAYPFMIFFRKFIENSIRVLLHDMLLDK